MRDHWHNCIAHFDAEVEEFFSDYFGESHRRCLLVAAAGFDARATRVAEMLAPVLSVRAKGLFIRENRRNPQLTLLAAADANENRLRQLVPDSDVEQIDVFGDDEAAIGGPRIASLLNQFEIPNDVTDVVLDLSALSIGIGFPAAKLLLSNCETVPGRSFHLMVVSNPESDRNISSEPSDRPMAVKGFAGTGHLIGATDVAKLWLPQLSTGRGAALTRIRGAIGECYAICPMLPFPARDPRRADMLLAEFESQLTNEWQVDPRDYVYVSERNPLDCFRTLSTLKSRYDRSVSGIFVPHMILTPVGGKVAAAGALMAAIEHDLTVQYVESIRYRVQPDWNHKEGLPDMVVHLLLSGDAYG